MTEIILYQAHTVSLTWSILACVAIIELVAVITAVVVYFAPQRLSVAYVAVKGAVAVGIAIAIRMMAGGKG